MVNGSFSASDEFDTEDGAKEYLRKRAEKFNDEHIESEEELAEMNADINCGCLTLDAVTAHIEEKKRRRINEKAGYNLQNKLPIFLI